MNRLRHTLLVTAGLLAAAAHAHAHAQTAPRVEAAWARPTVAGQGGAGAYLKITGGSAPDRLLGASAAIARHAQLHTMAMDGDVMRMREVDAVAIGAGETVELKPGGIHVMFAGLAQPLKNGSHFPLRLRFEKAGEVKVDVKVMPGPAMAPMAHQH